MTERAPFSSPDDPRRAASERPVDPRAASAPVELVKTCCPTLIATLVAIARAPKDGQDVDESAAASQGSRLCAMYAPAMADRPTRTPADVAP